MAPLLITLGLLYPVATMISYIVREKEMRQKELMKMMSVRECDIEFSWFCTFVTKHMITATCTAAVSSILYEAASLVLLWLFWVLTFLAVIAFSITCSALASKSSRAIVVGLLAFFSGAFLTMAVDFQTSSPSVLSLVSLHPVAAFSYGIRLLGYLEDLDLGLTRETINYEENTSALTMLAVYRFLAMDTILWSILAWYLNRVVAPDYGQALPFWFPFDVSAWFGITRNFPSFVSSCSTDDAIQERVGNALKKQTEQGESIEIRNLRKEFDGKPAVNGLNLTMYNGQITALLGHNGTFPTLFLDSK